MGGGGAEGAAMTIRNMEAFVGGLWDWGVLNGCFGETRIHPTDVDGLIERCGCFLFLEAKPDGGELTTGQRITFERLSQQPRTLVIWFCGDPAAQKITRIVRYWKGVATEVPDPSLERLRELVRRWYEWANGHSRN